MSEGVAYFDVGAYEPLKVAKDHETYTAYVSHNDIKSGLSWNSGSCSFTAFGDS